MTRSKWARLVLVMAVTDDARLKLETAERQQAKIGNGTAGKLACAEAAEIISSHHSAQLRLPSGPSRKIRRRVTSVSSIAQPDLHTSITPCASA